MSRQLRFHPIPFTPTDEAWLEWQTLVTRKIVAIFGISQQDIGLETINRTLLNQTITIEKKKGQLDDAPTPL